MADNSKFNSTVESLFSGMDNFVSAKTVVGDAVTVNNIKIFFLCISPLQIYPQLDGAPLALSLCKAHILIFYAIVISIHIRNQSSVFRQKNHAPPLCLSRLIF